jgi:L-lactate dehydrogenase complex protein LldG
MSTQETMLKSVREALQAGGKAHPHAPATTKSPRDFLPVTGGTLAERLELFARHSADLKTSFVRVKDAAEAGRKLAELAQAEQWKKVAAHHGELTDAATNGLNLPMLWTNGGYVVAEMESCDAGITACDLLIAQTGSVLVTSRTAGGRALTVLPPHHVVLARASQMVGGLPDAFAWIKDTYGANAPSMISFITGPSRTGDIERILVLGAHGPKKLTVFCLD